MSASFILKGFKWCLVPVVIIGAQKTGRGFKCITHRRKLVNWVNRLFAYDSLKGYYKEFFQPVFLANIRNYFLFVQYITKNLAACLRRLRLAEMAVMSVGEAWVLQKYGIDAPLLQNG